jgi:L-aspartate oxidase
LGSVTVLSKDEPVEGNTLYAQGGIASVTSPEDSFESHVRDTLECGAGLCHRDVVELVVRSAPKTIEHLTELGTNFDRDPKAENGGKYQLGREGGHSERRILHSGDHTGADIQRALFERASKHPNITFCPQSVAIDFILRTPKPESIDGEVLGVYALDRKTGKINAFSAGLTLLAAGGMGKVYLYTSNPDVATGDGIAMAYRAGAIIANMEFIQFHPTCLYHPRAKSFLLTEALRGEGARLITIRGERFMSKYHQMEELAPRDIVARAIDDQMKRSGDDFVLLDISHRDAEFIKSRFPTVYAKAKEFGFDLTKEPVPVVPAAHYCCGGVKTDLWGRTNLARLDCAGEAASTGLHGANRLASNSLLEAMVFAERAAQHTKTCWKDFPKPGPVPEWDPLDTTKSSEEVLVS